MDKLNTPLLVHVATNDEDVNFVEDQQIVDALRSRKPDLAETKVYVDPAPWGSSVGHAFSRRSIRRRCSASIHRRSLIPGIERGCSSSALTPL